jgi:hypothetical protein
VYSLSRGALAAGHKSSLLCQMAKSHIVSHSVVILKF